MRGRKKPSMVVAAPDGEANLGTIGRALWRNKFRIAVPTVLVAIVAAITVNMLTPKYKSEARVLVEGRENSFLRPEVDRAVVERGVVDAEAITSQVQLILSRDLAREVIAQLHLVDLPEFNPTRSSGLSPMAVLGLLGFSRGESPLTVEERVLSAYSERLTAFPVDKSRVIAIEFQSSDPELAARAANAIAERYLAMQRTVKQEQVRSAGQWLSGELEKLRGKVSESEAKVEDYRAKSNLFLGANNTSLIGQQLTELSSQITSARAQKADAETRARLIREQLKSGHSLESADVTNSELIRRLSEQRMTLRAQLAEQSSTLLPQHPRIKELRAQVADFEQQIRTEGERLVRSLENDAKVAGARVVELNANLDQLKRQTASTSDQDVQLRALEREAKAQRDLFESYLAKYREASARDSIAAAPADARIISRAVVSNTPFFPKKLPIVLIATLGTFCLCAAFVITGALLAGEPYQLQIDTTPVEPVEVERSAAQPLPRSADVRTRLGDRIPFGAGLRTPVRVEPAATPSVVPAETPMTSPAEQVDAVGAMLQRAGEGGRRVAVIGSARDVGTTLTSIALARTLARNARVVLVDLALESPNINVISSDPSAPGITDLMHGTASFGDIITRDRFSRVHIVAAGMADVDTIALLSSHMLLSALDALATSYDYLVLDAGAESAATIASIVQIAPRAVLVTGASPSELVAESRDQLHAAGFSDVTVLTGPPPPLDHAAATSVAA